MSLNRTLTKCVMLRIQRERHRAQIIKVCTGTGLTTKVFRQMLACGNFKVIGVSKTMKQCFVEQEQHSCAITGTTMSHSLQCRGDIRSIYSRHWYSFIKKNTAYLCAPIRWKHQYLSSDTFLYRYNTFGMLCFILNG